MGFLNYGTAKAGSYKHDYNKDIDRLYQNEEYRSRKEAEAQREAQYLSQMMQEQNPVNQSIIPELENYYEELNKKQADLITANPDWKTNVGVLKEINANADLYINNPLILEDKQGQQEFEKLRQAMSSQKLTSSQATAEMKRYRAWMEDHNAVDEMGNKIGPYVYSDPKQFTTTDVLKDVLPLIGSSQSKYINDDGYVVSTSGLNKTAAYKAYDNLMSQDAKETMDAQYQQLKANPLTAKLYPTVQQYTGAMIMNSSDDIYQKYQKASDASGSGSGSGTKNKYIPYWMMAFDEYNQNGEIESSNANLSFTNLGEVGSYRALPAQGEKQYVYGGENGSELIPVELTGSMVVKGGGRIFRGVEGDTDGSSAFGEASVAIFTQPTDSKGNPMNITVDPKGKKIYKDGNKVKYDELSEEEQAAIDIDDDGKYSVIKDPSYEDQLKAWGFEIQQVEMPSLIGNITGGKVVANAWVGQIVTKANFSQSKRDIYDRTRGNTSEAMSQAYNAGVYDIDITNPKQVGTQDPTIIKAEINKARGNDIRAGWGIDPDSMNWYEEDGKMVSQDNEDEDGLLWKITYDPETKKITRVRDYS
jgi:hypothetical protein